MKINRIVISTILMVSGLFFFSCDEKTDDEKCGDPANEHWGYISPQFWEINAGTATYQIYRNANGYCVFKNTEITIHIGETSNSSIMSVLGYIVLQKSTAPTIYFTHDTIEHVWRSNSYSLNLRQEFDHGPGNFDVKVLIYIPASTEAEAAQKFNASIEIL